MVGVGVFLRVNKRDKTYRCDLTSPDYLGDIANLKRVFETQQQIMKTYEKHPSLDYRLSIVDKEIEGALQIFNNFGDRDIGYTMRYCLPDLPPTIGSLAKRLPPKITLPRTRRRTRRTPATVSRPRTRKISRRPHTASRRTATRSRAGKTIR